MHGAATRLEVLSACLTKPFSAGEAKAVSTPEANMTVSKTASPKGSLSTLMPAEADTSPPASERTVSFVGRLIEHEVREFEYGDCREADHMEIGEHNEADPVHVGSPWRQVCSTSEVCTFETPPIFPIAPPSRPFKLLAEDHDAGRFGAAHCPDAVVARCAPGARSSRKIDRGVNDATPASPVEHR